MLLEKSAADSFTLSDAATKSLLGTLTKVYQLVREVSAIGQTPNAIIYQLVREVSCLAYPPRIYDSLELTDAVALDLQSEGATPLTQETSEDLNSWDELTNLTLGSELLDADDLNNWDDSKDTFSDCFYSSTEDLNSWDDWQSLNYIAGGEQSGADNLELSDSIEVDLSSREVSDSDTLSLSDAIAQDFVEKYIASTLGLDVMYFYDRAQVDFLVFSHPYTETAADSIVGGKNKRASGLRDSISWELVAKLQQEALWNAADDIFIIDDDFSIQLGFLNDTPTAEDSLDSWDDVVEGVLGVAEAYDSNMYNWSDAASLTPGDAVFADEDTLELSDEVSTSASSVWLSASGASSFTLTDAATKTFGLVKLAYDFLVLADRGIAQFKNTNLGTDTLAFSDIIQLVFSYSTEGGDTLTLTDAGTKNINEPSTPSSNADSMALTDTVSVLLSTSDISYLRRYLNDVPR